MPRYRRPHDRARPDITRLIDRLSRRGLVARVRGRQDRRVVEVAITDKGREVLRRLDPHVNRMPPAVIGHLGARKLKQLGFFWKT